MFKINLHMFIRVKVPIVFANREERNPGIRGCSILLQINYVNSNRQVDRQEQREVECARERGWIYIYIYIYIYLGI